MAPAYAIAPLVRGWIWPCGMQVPSINARSERSGFVSSGGARGEVNRRAWDGGMPAARRIGATTKRGRVLTMPCGVSND